MKNLLLITALFVASTATAQELIWSDEFNGSQLDETKWNYETGTGIDGNWGTGQLDAATSRDENVHIENGVAGADGGALVITTRKENYSLPSGGTRSYTSGRINTKDKASWGPGHRILARVWPRDVRFQGQGFAFWMMPQEIPNGFDYLMWPQGGEIDIMEFVGMTPYANLGSVHYAPNWNNNQWNANNHWHQGAYYSFEDQENPGAFPQWISVDLGQQTSLTKVVLKWETAFGKSYEIQASDDGLNWTSLFSTTTGNGAVDEIPVTGSGRYVRVYASERGTQWGYSLYEVEVYNNDQTNLALNKIAVSSTTESNTLTANNAVDGNAITRWASGDINSPSGGWPASASDIKAGNYNFKTYGIDWYQDRMEFHVDGIIYHIHYFNDGGGFAKDGQNQAAASVINGKRVYKSEFSNRFSQWQPFEHEFFAILSAGVGGTNTYGGTIVSEAQFPASVFIDWVRVYAFEPTETVTSSEDQSHESIVAHPNPTERYIRLPKVRPGTEVDIIDINGKALKETVAKDHSLDLQNVSQGLYVLQYKSDKKVITMKVIKR